MQCQYVEGFQCNLKLGILIDPVLGLAGTVSQRCFDFAISGFVLLSTPWGFDTTDDRIDTLWFAWIPDRIRMILWALECLRLQLTPTSFC